MCYFIFNIFSAPESVWENKRFFGGLAFCQEDGTSYNISCEEQWYKTLEQKPLKKIKIDIIQPLSYVNVVGSPYILRIPAFLSAKFDEHLRQSM